VAKRTRFKAFITKYALTDGIQEVEVEDCFDTSPTMVRPLGNKFTYYHAKDWYLTRDGAVQRAEKMRVDKALSLKKQLKRLEEMRF